MNDIQRLFHRHAWEAVTVGFFLMFALYTIGFATGYYVAISNPVVPLVPITDVIKDNDATVLPDRTKFPVIIFRAGYVDEAVSMKPCWSTVSLEGPTP